MKIAKPINELWICQRYTKSKMSIRAIARQDKISPNRVSEVLKKWAIISKKEAA